MDKTWTECYQLEHILALNLLDVICSVSWKGEQWFTSSYLEKDNKSSERVKGADIHVHHVNSLYCSLMHFTILFFFFGQPPYSLFFFIQVSTKKTSSPNFSVLVSNKELYFYYTFSDENFHPQVLFYMASPSVQYLICVSTTISPCFS